MPTKTNFNQKENVMLDYVVWTIAIAIAVFFAYGLAGAFGLAILGFAAVCILALCFG